MTEKPHPDVRVDDVVRIGAGHLRWRVAGIDTTRGDTVVVQLEHTVTGTRALLERLTVLERDGRPVR